jgi:hypothetical protein
VTCEEIYHKLSVRNYEFQRTAVRGMSALHSCEKLTHSEWECTYSSIKSYVFIAISSNADLWVTSFLRLTQISLFDKQRQWWIRTLNCWATVTWFFGYLITRFQLQSIYIAPNEMGRGYKTYDNKWEICKDLGSASSRRIRIEYKLCRGSRLTTCYSKAIKRLTWRS